MMIILGPLGGALVLITSGIVEPLMERLVWGIIGGRIEVEDWPENGPVELRVSGDIPLPQLPFDLQVNNVVLDDCALIGSSQFPDPAYEWPAPDLEIVGEMIESSSESEGIKALRTPFVWVNGFRFTVNYAHRGDFRAVPRMMAYPIDFRWCLGGRTITGEGSMIVDETEIVYSVAGDRCALTVGMGDSVETELCVTAIDGRGVELFAARPISVQGSASFNVFVGEELADPSLLYMGAPSLIESELFPEEEMTIDSYSSMIASAFKRGMGVNPWEKPK